MKRDIVVAIDGPAGAGKSTVSRRLASRLGFDLVDTGALYRCVALAARNHGLALNDDTALEALMPRLQIQFRPDPIDHQPHVYCEGRDVTGDIREPAIGNLASQLSARPVVRDGLLDLQRNAGRSAAKGAVLEGRDIGTVVFPDAEAKFFLTADPRVRAERRFRELSDKGVATTFDAVLDEQARRDRDDASRAVAPLRQSRDAELIDSTALSLEQVVDAMESSLRRRGLVP